MATVTSSCAVLPPCRPSDELQRLLAECKQIRAEGRRARANTKRLRLDCVKARLDLAERLTTFGDPKVYGETLVAVFRSRALTTYKSLRDAISSPGWTGMDRQALESRLNRLHLLLIDRGILEADADPGERPKFASLKTLPVAIRENHSDGLTRREREVLKCIAEGHSTKQVAGQLGIAFKTAACHRYRIMDKLGIHDTASLVRYAIRAGLIHP
jgi:DNA-binding CsgD family transcriptional regulator